MAVLVLPFSKLDAFYTLIDNKFSDDQEGDLFFLDPNVERAGVSNPARRCAFGHPLGPRITAAITTWISNHPTAGAQLLDSLPANWRYDS